MITPIRYNDVNANRCTRLMNDEERPSDPSERAELQRVQTQCRKECAEAMWERFGIWLLVITSNTTASADCKNHFITACRTARVSPSATTLIAQYYLIRQRLRQHYFQDTSLYWGSTVRTWKSIRKWPVREVRGIKWVYRTTGENDQRYRAANAGWHFYRNEI